MRISDHRVGIYDEATQAAGVGLVVNAFLAILKLGGGVFTGSLALLADALNSLGDVVTSLIVRRGLIVAQRDADEEHPYGHTKAESIAGLTVSLLILFSAIGLAWETVRGLGLEREALSKAAVWVAFLAAITKELLYRYTIRSSHRLHSRSLQAAAWDHRCDALASGAIALALGMAPFLGQHAWIVDPLAALGICFFLIYVGIGVYRKTAEELMDQQGPTAFVEQIGDLALKDPDVRVVETLRVRKSGLEFFVEIHLEVDGQMSVIQGHCVGHRVKDAIMLQFPQVRDVHVHIEPYPRHD